MDNPFHPQRILVVGGGPFGLVTLRNLVERGNFERVELVERRDDVGGVWYMDEYEEKNSSHRPRWPSPAYPGLIGNILPEFLSFSGSPFSEPPSTPQQPFPTLKETYDYLRDFAEPFIEKGSIRLNTEVVQIDELADAKGWDVAIRDWTLDEGKTHSEIWDAVVICTGWYDDPLWPETEGIDDLKKKGLAQHAKSYRGPEKHAGKRALVVGNGNSANDIAAHLAPVAQNPIYRSIRRSAFKHFVHLPNPRIQDVAPIKRFSVQDNDKAMAELHDGTLLQDIDVVFICSGYIPNPTFLHVRAPNDTSSDSSGLSPFMSQINPESPQSRRIPSLHRHILYAHNPTLAFMGSVMCFTPFTIADVSSTWLGLAWSNEVAYPASAKDRLQFEKDLIEDIERRRADEAQETGREASSLFTYSALGSLEEDYAAGLKRDIVAARPEMKDVLPDWNATTKAVRESMYSVKYRSLLWLKKQREQGAVDEAVDGEDAGYRTHNVAAVPV